MRQSSLLIIFLVVFIDLVGFGIVIPILPYYATQFGASAWELGWLMAVYSLAQFLFSPFWGWVSDYVGRRPVLLVSLLGTSASMMILGMAGSLKWLFIGRIFAGFCGANISTAYAYITDTTKEEDRAKGMGMIGAGFGLGFIFGPAIGGLLSRYGYEMPMLAGAALALANFVFAFFKLEEPRLTREARSGHRTKRFDTETIRLALGNGMSRHAILLFFLVTFAVTQMEVIFAIYMAKIYGFNAESAGVVLAIVGLVMAGVQGGLIGKLAKRFGEMKLVIWGSILCSFGLFAFVSVRAVGLAVCAMLVMAVGHGVLHPSLSTLASFGAQAQRRGATMGVFQSAGALARVFGPPCAGWLYDQMSWRSPFYCGSVVLIVVAVLATIQFMRTRSEPAFT